MQQRRPNRLIHARSPYLRQHAWNPVDWHEWNPETLAQARREQKPVFLSIGYSSCHWCHVMERESFDDPEIAAFLNAHFIPIKVDREERPDIDWIYMQAVMALTGQGGWPLNVFLTPDLEPFYGGTYYPPTDRYGRPGFMRILREVHRAWTERREDILEIGRELRRALQAAVQWNPSGEDLTPVPIRQTVEKLLASFDSRWGGFGSAPKFPPHAALYFLMPLRRRDRSGSIARVIDRTLTGIACGGIHDHVGGGFHRYAVDHAWRIPHFEKMLYDNAFLADLYTRAWLTNGRPFYRYVACGIFDYLLRDMRSPEGAFYTSEDADADGKEGMFYVWTPAALQAVLPPEDAAWVIETFGVTPEGNFEDGTSVLAVVSVDPDEEPAFLEPWKSIRARLLEHRNQRPRPHRDEKILTDWNALTIAAFACGGAVFENQTYLEAAITAFEFLWDTMWDVTTQALYHRSMDGERGIKGFLFDYAALCMAAVTLYEVTGRMDILERAVQLADAFHDTFGDTATGGYFDAPADDRERISPVRESFDGALPAGNSMAAFALTRLYHLTGEERFRRRFETILKLYMPVLNTYPENLAFMTAALDFHLTEPVAILTALEDASRLPAVRTELMAMDLWYRVLGWVLPGRQPGWLPFRDKTVRSPAATFYLCRGFVCDAPVTSMDDVRKRIEAIVRAMPDPRSPANDMFEKDDPKHDRS